MLNLLFGVRGRIGRGSWWLAQFIAIPVIILVGMSGLAGTVSLADPDAPSAMTGAAGFLIIAVAVIATLWINVASTIKRFHDRGKSGWWFLIVFVPLIGGIWQLVECGFCSGEDGDNAYGPPPGSAAAREALANEISGLKGSASKLAKLDDDYFKNYAAAQGARMSEPMVQQTYSRPSATVSPGTGKPVFGKR